MEKVKGPEKVTDEHIIGRIGRKRKLLKEKLIGYVIFLEKNSVFAMPLKDIRRK